MESYYFTIPGDPKGKQRPRVGNGRAYTPSLTISYENLVKASFAERFPGLSPTVMPVAVQIDAYLPIPKSAGKKKLAAMMEKITRPLKKPDWDNIGKIVCDALNTIAWHDDSQVISAAVNKYYSDRPRVDVKIYILTTAETYSAKIMKFELGEPGDGEEQKE